MDFQRESEALLDATLDMDAEAVARGIEMEYKRDDGAPADQR